MLCWHERTVIPLADEAAATLGDAWLIVTRIFTSGLANPLCPLLAIVLSYIPPVSNFVILLRLTSSSPPPLWQAWLAVVVGAAGVYVLLWFAAKVFRVGLLMFGKPPTLGTLIRWARMS